MRVKAVITVKTIFFFFYFPGLSKPNNGNQIAETISPAKGTKKTLYMIKGRECVGGLGKGVK